MQTTSIPYRCSDEDRFFLDDLRRVYSAAIRTAYANASTADGTEPKEMDLRNLNPNSIRIAAEANVEDPGSVGHTRLLEHAQQGVELLGKDADRLDSYGLGDHDHIYTQHGPQPAIRIRDLKSGWPF
ncbi:hypothetical protein E5S70_30360 [Ensifer adhaerens]|uniref:hypothetical protein n=1 Tax=Ensifer canadensis TaxID=555315 RepID=UPI00148FE925|nr:hypothetical protein [Ensifer canadensis]NOV20309.1 hypothetical protein [Ensifer canadensis]